MTATTTAGLAAAGALLLLGAGALVWLVDLEGPGLAGAAVGAGLGLVNLLAGWWITNRALRRGMRSALRTVLGGFLVRLLLLSGLILWFHFLEAVDEVAFALSFLTLFFVYVAFEVVLVDRALRRKGSPA